MQVLRRGLKGGQVQLWQNFLVGSGIADVVVDGDFGPGTEAATKKFQLKKGLATDGVVGRSTLAAAIADGFGSFPDAAQSEDSPNWPPRPNFQPLVSTLERERVFGKFAYVSAPAAGNPEAIKITDGWAKANIIPVKIPQLAGVSGAPANCVVHFHALIVPQLTTMWARWEQAGLLPLVKNWGGSFVPRFVRGSRTHLSNHAFGTAFDINVQWNALGAEPALADKTGSVRRLVPIANECGFYWGGHFGGRPDGMHFEAAHIV